MKWTVVIPAYNEAERIEKTLARIAVYTQRRPGGEVIVVDDGSVDETSRIIQDVAAPNLSIKLIRHASNRGKGAAVRTGIGLARGEWILVMDADGSVAIEELELLLPPLQHVPIVIGSKYLDPSADTHQQDLIRTLIAKGGNFLVRQIFGLRYTDTQCGFKLLNHDVATDLFQRMVINRWGFDIELLVLAQRLGYSVREIPIHWTNTDDSRVSVVPAARDTIWELAQIWWRLLRGRYELPSKRPVIPVKLINKSEL